MKRAEVGGGRWVVGRGYWVVGREQSVVSTLLLFMLLILAVPLASATVSDSSGLLNNFEKKILNGISGEDLCITLAREGTLNTTLSLFSQKKNVCRVLVLFTDRDSKIRIAQPEQKALTDTEIKQALAAFEQELRTEKQMTVRDRKRAALMAAAEVLAGALEKAPRPSDFCAKLKDGVCDAHCPGVDPDCLCGNGVCEYFEQETCEADCAKKEWLCAVIQDGSCGAACGIKDIDCRLDELRGQLAQPEKKRILGTGALAAVFGSIALIIIALFIFMLHWRVENRNQENRNQENKKGISFLPSKVFLYFFALIALVAGMGLFIMMSSRIAEAETTAVPAAAKAVALYRLINSPNCFADEDEPGTIMLERFTQEQLDACFMIPPSVAHKQCFKLALHDYRFGQQKLIKEIQTTNFAQCAAAKKIITEPVPVLIADHDTIKRGVLIISSKKED